MPQQGLSVKIISVVPDAWYEDRAYGFYVRIENQDGVQWDLLDSKMQANPDLVGKTCHVEMVAFLGEIEQQEGSEKAMKTGSVYLPLILGQIVELEAIPFQPPYQHPKPMFDLSLLLDVGDGRIESFTVHQVEHEDEIAKLNFKVGDYVIHHVGRMDLVSIIC